MAIKPAEKPKPAPKEPPKDVKPDKPATKEETRLFQVDGERKWLTKAEATAAGMFWKD